MRLIIRMTSFLVLSVGVTAFIYFGLAWNDAKTILNLAEEQIEVTSTSKAFLNQAESVMAFSEFEKNWARGGFPCPTLKSYWTTMSQTKFISNGVPVSHFVVRDLKKGLPPERSTDSIVRDIFATCLIERRYETSVLLRHWLSKAYFGNGEFGIEVAAASLFNMRAEELDVDEAAQLVVLLRHPQLRDRPERWSERSQYISEQYFARGHSFQF